MGQSTLDVDLPATWNFIEHVFGQIADMTTTSDYIHVGGDESHSTLHDDYVNFITKTVKIVHDLGKKPIGWNEASIRGLFFYFFFFPLILLDFPTFLSDSISFRKVDRYG